ncbi:MAG: vWA domain-containing protein [Planctomycetota bacterium]
MIQRLRRWWQVKTGRVETPIDGEVPFWLVSFAVHLGILVLLARILMPANPDKDVYLTMDTEDEVDLVEIAPEIQFDDLPMEEIGADSQDAFDAAAAEAERLDIENEDPVQIDMPEYELGELITDNDFLEATADKLSMVNIKGTVGESVTGASGAVDRITQEIVNSLHVRKTMVVWLFDESASLLRQRDEIVQRFDRVYEELGILQDAGSEAFARHSDTPLLTHVAGFGRELHHLTDKPTEDLDEIKDAVESIVTDESGIENVFQSIGAVVEKFKSYSRTSASTGDRERNVMIVVVSDEAGDDGEYIDECVRLCNKYETPVYVIGVPAPFGRKETEVKWVDPDPEYDQTPQFALVSQGPETLLPERIRLDFTAMDEDYDMIDSGFGPFNLTRLAYETGGIYFAVHPNRQMNTRVRRYQTEEYAAFLEYFFDPEVMRRYRPDYVSREVYYERLKSNAARQALVDAASFSSTGVLESPVLRFPRLDEGRFINQVSTAQQAAARVEPALEQLYNILKQGEADRPVEMEPRWQAGYDLAMGRTLAARVRATSYNAMLAMAKTSLEFEDPPNDETPKNNVWVLVPADTIETGSREEKLAERAREYLQQVVENHPETPWALLAARELETPIGWRWVEDYQAPPRPREPGNPVANNNNRPMPQPMQNRPAPPPRRAPPRL